MSHYKIRPVILSGGLGTRLWPVSDASRPKQFTQFFEDRLPFFAETLQRVHSQEDYLPPIIIGNTAHLALIHHYLDRLDIRNARIISEPISCNTAAAALTGALSESENGVLHLLMPSDHHVEDEAQFHHLVQKAAASAQAERIVLFGITPGRPETGYGYIMPDRAEADDVTPIQKFLEKPDRLKAASLIAEGALWNSGIFLYAPETIMNEVLRIDAVYYQQCLHAVDNAVPSDNTLFIASEDYLAIPSASFDTLIMENTEKGSVIAGAFGWSDVGSWESLWEISQKNEDNNAIKGNVITRDVLNSYIHSDGIEIAALGMRDCVVVAKNNRILITKIAKSQEVKYIAASAENEFTTMQNSQQLSEMDAPPYLAQDMALGVHDTYWRPWGKFKNIARGKNYLIKHLYVKPSSAISLQKHEERCEHWVVIEGEATVEIDNEIQIFYADQPVFIPRHSLHRLSNNAESTLKIIEIQSGAYLSEDDIVRYDDRYGRV